MSNRVFHVGGTATDPTHAYPRRYPSLHEKEKQAPEQVVIACGALDSRQFNPTPSLAFISPITTRGSSAETPRGLKRVRGQQDSPQTGRAQQAPGTQARLFSADHARTGRRLCRTPDNGAFGQQRELTSTLSTYSTACHDMQSCSTFMCTPS